MSTHHDVEKKKTTLESIQNYRKYARLASGPTNCSGNLFIFILELPGLFIYQTEEEKLKPTCIHQSSLLYFLAPFFEGCFQEEHAFLNGLAPKLLDPDYFLIENTSHREVFLPFG